jgi:hypothetical protein
MHHNHIAIDDTDSVAHAGITFEVLWHLPLPHVCMQTIVAVLHYHCHLLLKLLLKLLLCCMCNDHSLQQQQRQQVAPSLGKLQQQAPQQHQMIVFV